MNFVKSIGSRKEKGACGIVMLINNQGTIPAILNLNTLYIAAYYYLWSEFTLGGRGNSFALPKLTSMS